MAAKVYGAERLRAKLRALPAAVKAEIRKAMEQGANEIVAMAKGLAPVESGALRDSIGWTWGDAPKGSIVLATSRSGSADELRLTIYAGNENAFYARWQEFGRANMPANAFFYPSYRALRRRVRGRVSRATTAAARRVAAGGQ